MVRYDTTDHKGETRRQRNERFGMAEKNQNAKIPPAGIHVLEWFWSFNRFRPAGESIEPLTYEGLAHWALGTGNRMCREEAAAIMAMDGVYRKTLREEIDSNVARQRAEAERKT
jgi:hypothetical protein